MRIFSKPFCGCKAGDIYPTDFKIGDECPDELLEAASLCDVLEPATEKAKGKPKRG